MIVVLRRRVLVVVHLCLDGGDELEPQELVLRPAGVFCYAVCVLRAASFVCALLCSYNYVLFIYLCGSLLFYCCWLPCSCFMAYMRNLLGWLETRLAHITLYYPRIAYVATAGLGASGLGVVVIFLKS